MSQNKNTIYNGNCKKAKNNIYIGIVLKFSSFYCDFSTESFLFSFLNCYIGERKALKTVLTPFIKHLLTGVY